MVFMDPNERLKGRRPRRGVTRGDSCRLSQSGLDFADDCRVDLQHELSFYVLSVPTSRHVLEPYLGLQA
jgi:hypothetical protein